MKKSLYTVRLTFSGSCIR